MATLNSPDLAALYLADETAWLDIMAGLARDGRVDQLDLANLAEFLESMANRDRREVAKRLTVLLAHLLKWDLQPDKRSKSWVRTILTQQIELESLFESETLRAHAVEVAASAYRKAIRLAAGETDLTGSAFPVACPYTVEAALAFRPRINPA